VEVLPLRAAARARRRCRQLRLRRRVRVPAAGPPPPRPQGSRRRAALRRRLPRHHHQEGLAESRPPARPAAGPQRAGGNLPLPSRDAGHPRRRRVAAARPRLAGGPLAGVRHLHAGRQGDGPGGRDPAHVPLQRAVRVGAGGADRRRAGAPRRPHRQQLRDRRPGEEGGRVVVCGAGAVGAERVREPGGPHQLRVRGLLRPPQEDGADRRGRSGQAGDQALGEGPAARHREGRLRAAAPVPVGRADREPRSVAGLQGGARDPPVVEARPVARVHRALLLLITV
jgi:hypothetical protein